MRPLKEEEQRKAVHQRPYPSDQQKFAHPGQECAPLHAACERRPTTCDGHAPVMLARFREKLHRLVLA